MRYLQPLRFLQLTTLFAILGCAPVVIAQPTPEIIVSYPPGALAVFPRSVYEQEPNVRKIFLRADGADGVWVVEATRALVPSVTGDRSKIETAIGFLIPQLPKGRYVAWYEPSNQAVIESMTLEIGPQLLGDVGITRGAPGGDVEVAIRIYSPNVARSDGETPRLATAEITLSSADSKIAALANNQAPTVLTDREGIATWRVHIHQSGIVPFTATAKGFEPTIVAVVGMPLPMPTFLEAALRASEMRAQRLAVAAEQARQLAQRLENVLEKQSERLTGVTENPAENKRLSQMQARVDALNKEAADKSAEATAARIELVNLNTQMAAQPRSISEADLKPGDILLVRGTTPVVSLSITKFETAELQSDAPYSHASIYLGSGKVAEMLLNGFYVTSLKESTKSDLLVDIYRLEGIDDAKRAEIARHAAQPYGPGIGSGSPVPYALSQIGVLVYIAAMRTSILGWILSPDVRAAVAAADQFAGGKRKMICSELVAWIYRDAGLDIQVTHWKRFSNLKLLTTEDRRKDYTTPNMLARSTSLRRVGRYLGP